MKIYSPNKLHWITQGFGLANTAQSLIPLYQSLGLKGHDGLDFAVNCKDIYARRGGQCEQLYCNVIGTGDLTVTYIQKDDAGGYGIVAIDEQWNKFLWWHFEAIDPLIYLGRKLKLGDVLGVAGNTGISTGAHCHFAWYRYGEDYNNGYKGASDPTPFYDPRFCVDIKTQIGLLQKLVDLYLAIIKILKK